MPHLGAITRGVSDVIEWQIPNFIAVVTQPHLPLSPRFSLEGRTWYLRLCWGAIEWMSIILCKDDSCTAATTVTFSLGIKNTDGTVEEKVRRVNCTFSNYGSENGQKLFLSLEDLRKRKSELLTPGTLTIVCRMERGDPTPEQVSRDPSPKVDSRRAMLVELETLSSNLKDLFINERRCDFTMNVQGKEFRVHRSVLSARSSVFLAMFEHDTAEAKSGIMTIPDCNPDSFGDFLSYLYTGKMEEIVFSTAYDLYATAEKYDVQELKSFCVGYLKENLTLENFCDVVVLADLYSDEELMSSAQDFFGKNSYRIFLTSEWATLLKNDVRLGQKLLSEMAHTALKTS